MRWLGHAWDGVEHDFENDLLYLVLFHFFTVFSFGLVLTHDAPALYDLKNPVVLTTPATGLFVGTHQMSRQTWTPTIFLGHLRLSPHAEAAHLVPLSRGEGLRVGHAQSARSAQCRFGDNTKEDGGG